MAKSCVPSKWDRRFMELAKHVAQWSKDPSTKVGAVIADVNNRVISLGFNGLPVGVRDLPERLENRDEKLELVVHAEINAILFAGKPLWDCVLYTWPMAPCSRCASMVAQTGIRRVIAPRIYGEHRWAESVNKTELTFAEAGISLEYLTDWE